ncbi:MAG: DUF2806 domain-containing protein [Victivallales bacterium]|nr:DUF2806 domain-containing protein [Victivallales bacterium]
MPGDVHFHGNVGDLAKPACILIEKIYDAGVGVFKPYQTKRVAKAESKAFQMKAKNDIDIKLLNRTWSRFIEEETRKQENMEAITVQALPLLEDNSNSNAIENDWITNFFDKCRITSDKEMQSLWSKVLAGEANIPGTYSKRTVNFLSDLDKAEAMLFTQVCGYGWQIHNEFVPIIDNADDDIFKKNDINFDTLIHLKSIGLIHFNHISTIVVDMLPKAFNASYFDSIVSLEMDKDHDNRLDIGYIALTQIGKELAPICGRTPVTGFKEYILEKWMAQNSTKVVNIE